MYANATGRRRGKMSKTATTSLSKTLTPPRLSLIESVARTKGYEEGALAE